MSIATADARYNTPGTGTACAKKSHALDFSTNDASVPTGAVPIGVYVELTTAGTAGELAFRLVNDNEDIAVEIPTTGVYPYAVGTVRNSGTTGIDNVIALF